MLGKSHLKFPVKVSLGTPVEIVCVVMLFKVSGKLNKLWIKAKCSHGRRSF